MACSTVAKALLVLLAAAVFAVSVCTLGLTAHGVGYYQEHHATYVRVNYALYNGTTTTYNSTAIGYHPTFGVDMSGMYALVTAGILGTTLGLVILLASVWTGKGKLNVSLRGRAIRPIYILGGSTALVLEACLFVTFIITAGYAWSSAASKPRQYLDYTHITNYSANYAYYAGSDVFIFEHWNCALSHVAAGGSGPYWGGPGPGELYSLCQQAWVARILGLVLFALTAVMLVAHSWAWRRHNVAIRRAKAHEYGEEDVKAREAGSQSSSSERMRYELGGNGAVELPAHRLSRIEAPDNALRELPGENGSKELQAETVAWEMDAESVSVHGNGEKT